MNKEIQIQWPQSAEKLKTETFRAHFVDKYGKKKKMPRV